MPMVGKNMLFSVRIHVADPEVVQDMMTIHNKLLDKDTHITLMLRPFMGESFLFTQADEKWKEKRRACSNAFYKDKMSQLVVFL